MEEEEKGLQTHLVPKEKEAREVDEKAADSQGQKEPECSSVVMAPAC